VYSGGSGLGFDDYVLASFNGQTLYDSTSNQWARVISAMQVLPPAPLDDLVRNQQPELRSLNDALTRMTRFYKSEMASLLGLTITYSSNDGD
jgi:predicted lipoprotein